MRSDTARLDCIFIFKFFKNLHTDFHKTVYIPPIINVPLTFLTELGRISKIYVEAHKIPRIAKAILSQKKKTPEISQKHSNKNYTTLVAGTEKE